MNFEPGETVDLENGELAEVLADNGQDVDLKVISTGEITRRSVEALVEVNG